MRDRLLSTARSYGDAALLPLSDGSHLDLRTGHLPRLVNFTFEDKAAKGLRKLRDQTDPEPPVYFSALEAVRDNAALVLAGDCGSGKTSLALYLAYVLAGGGQAARAVPRNDLGAVHDEEWQAPEVLPLCLRVTAATSLRDLLGAAVPDIDELLHCLRPERGAPVPEHAALQIILDGVEAAGERGPALLQEAMDIQQRYPGVRVLALGETSVVRSWVLPAQYTRHELLPFTVAQRREALSGIPGVGPDTASAVLGEVGAIPAQFAMAVQARAAGGTPEILVDEWLAGTAGSAEEVRRLGGRAVELLQGAALDPDADPLLLGNRRVRQLLAARRLLTQRPETITESYRRDPALWAPVLRSLAVRYAGSAEANALVGALLEGSADDVSRGALLAVDLATDLATGLATDLATGLVTEPGALRERICGHLLAVVETGALTAPERERAGRVLSCWGDPRDLSALADVPAGTVVMGSLTHPNSAPPHKVTVDAFRIGLYPVTNAQYGAFVQETGHPWRSPDGFAEDRRNAPATDLTWRDARGYCAWLTDRWRACGRIGPDELVRLPTEPEWERASRGDEPDRGADTIVYPWGAGWTDDCANSEEAGFNATCTVGLFPRGRSPYGCYDMAGQVWEWTTTLWGEDMATPGFAYPYTSDGRENADAAPSVRRVLRGGCFSSGRAKACCTYRGSLEPDGFWRGNGFRIVVAGS
ncbi:MULTISPECIES: SUMF1/EgtB/PvdO family nonheme iron enzyme [unclassified Streptomyces]|uniref:SUMF1/EgtB/PvdO family nonheme iron enzyme n=1 Tax=unclassified Streptomyces TaxID=2593676 RepID=UPI0036E9BBAD